MSLLGDLLRSSAIRLLSTAKKHQVKLPKTKMQFLEVEAVPRFDLCSFVLYS